MSYHRALMETESGAGPATPLAQQTPRDTNGRYDFEIDLESDSTHATVVRLVGANKRVLELGPATGYMSRALAQHGCTVTGVEVDSGMAAQAAQHCERMIVGDLDVLDLDRELGSDRFDVIVAADVLEHLKDPLAALLRLRDRLEPSGFFVISVPNVAHGSVRLALLEGRFRYQPKGLLDSTHLHFFTHETIGQLLQQAELGVAEIHRQELTFDASEVRFDPAAVPPELIRSLAEDPDARTYQFVIKAIPLAVDGLRELQQQMNALAEDNAARREEIARLKAENAELRNAGAELTRLQEALTAISSREGQLRASLVDVHEQLLQRDEQLNMLREELVPLRRKLDRLKATPIGRLYIRLRSPFLKAKAVGRRLERYRSAWRKL